MGCGRSGVPRPSSVVISAPLIALTGGQIQFMHTTTVSAEAQIKSGRVRVVGLASAKRQALLPDVRERLTDFDPVVRETAVRTLTLPSRKKILLSDTVGFIRNLPKELMAAFRTTFEEIHEADLLLHVLDASSPDLDAKYNTVQKVLAELELDTIPTIVVLNKIDKADPETLEALQGRFDAICVCALDRASFVPLMQTIEQFLWQEVPNHAHAV